MSETFDRVQAACRTIQTAETQPALEDLARAAKLSASYFHRQFKAATGLTPKGYAAAHRASRVREELAMLRAGKLPIAQFVPPGAPGSHKMKGMDRVRNVIRKSASLKPVLAKMED